LPCAVSACFAACLLMEFCFQVRLTPLGRKPVGESSPFDSLIPIRVRVIKQGEWLGSVPWCDITRLSGKGIPPNYLVFENFLKCTPLEVLNFMTLITFLTVIEPFTLNHLDGMNMGCRVFRTWVSWYYCKFPFSTWAQSMVSLSGKGNMSTSGK